MLLKLFVFEIIDGYFENFITRYMSLDTERVGSIISFILGRRRGSLKSENLKNIIFINQLSRKDFDEIFDLYIKYKDRKRNEPANKRVRLSNDCELIANDCEIINV